MQLQAAGSHFGVTFAGLTHVGMRRSNNQDSICAAPASTESQWRKQGHLFVVADGMGAHAAGELASKLATDLIVQTYRKQEHLPPEKALVEAIQEANRQIHIRGQSDDEFRGMGTTVCVLVVLPRKIILANVGDSRIYRLRQGKLEQLTFDHSLVWELRAAQNLGFQEEDLAHLPKNVITRSLGPHPEVKIDLHEKTDLQPGDIFVLCSDGLSGPVADDVIGKVATLFPPDEAARLLVHLANYHGGPDNISVIVVRVDKVESGGHDRPDRWARPLQMLLRVTSPLAIAALVAMGVLLRNTWGNLALAGCLALAGAVLVGWMVLEWLFRRRYARPEPEGPLQTGPYGSFEAVPDETFVRYLADVVNNLQARGTQDQWPVDWQMFTSLTHQAEAALARGQIPVAAAAYGRAIVNIMDQLFTRSANSYPRRWPRV